MTDYWRLRYDKNRENERFYIIEKQNLSEVKNLIDLTVKLYNKARQNNYDYDNYLKKEEEKNKLKLEFKLKKDKEFINKQIIDKEIDLMDKRYKEKEFRKSYLNQIKIDEVKEQRYLDDQKEIIRKQKEWEMKNIEHMDKVEDLYQKKHSYAINEYFDILRKDIQRKKRLNLNKEQFAFKKNIENEKRDKVIADFKYNKKIMENYMRKKFENRHKHIYEFAEEQKEIKNNLIKSQQKERDKKFEKNIFLKKLNEDCKKERRDRLLEQFEINEEKVERRKIINEKMNEDKKFNNYKRHDTITANYIEQKNILIYRNLLKLNDMKNKNKEIEEKIKRRQLSAKTKMNRDNILKVKREQMINHVNKILDERKEHKIEDVYRRIFTNEETNLLKENESL